MELGARFRFRVRVRVRVKVRYRDRAREGVMGCLTPKKKDKKTCFLRERLNEYAETTACQSLGEITHDKTMTR